ncbi:pyridoxamine 5'-phosphate oxidase family protein [Ideonella sp.]|uniref:pyridoxamine 5'-phosphate oxidase family protein n=1 Tax=Ideonella sp. TaxID=1929293 RepID=UPI002B4981B3|nr:pyridoxamine 5'-phosphate oxidase family protein [Ideonella sp.]HJV71481.1 pyridoxamine 5'-phosphate oxidase family protein [Ideonella sp.]
MSSPIEPAGWPHAQPPFHAGERALQARAGLAERLGEIGRRVVRDHMPDQHRELFQKLPFMLLGALDAAGRPWATVATGRPGFVRTPDARTLVLGGRPLGEAALGLQLASGASVGLLGIEPATRRRNRVNGAIAASDEAGLVVQVRQSFGNCPKYIQAREPAPAETPVPPAAPGPIGRHLPPAAAALVRQADTFFIATASPDAAGGQTAPNGGVDVSHRGGKPGFVRVDDREGTTSLTAPDFAGNFFFNTLGNITLDPRAGLLFVDWADGHLLLLTGHAEVVWDGPELQAFAGAQRLLRFRLDEGWWLEGAMPLRAGAAELAPQLAATGAWEPQPPLASEN